MIFFFFKQKTAYEMRISDWSSDVCSSDLIGDAGVRCTDHLDQARMGRRERREISVHRHAGLVAAAGVAQRRIDPLSTEESRVGKVGVSPCRSRLLPYP